ncbi:NAD(P)-binding Rossmann-fold superfamily protein [Rhynchospora pubera]|uniref:NAD(P)-binding Rossmann-fold superfamily protein n=1 Tax=Rhynchospora pubera TaxID=906938 RepID=A0AAV8GL53_9POAL|nr:NAD(P)-binding Rossmann-fold superfamily protein [Rhynchospora pubera]
MFMTVKYLIGSAGPSGFGSKSTAEEVTEACTHISSITAIITGATSGIGAETARILAKRGARLILPVRSLISAEEMKARILSECSGSDIIILPLDLSSLASVQSFVSRFLSLGLPLNLLINNAGKFPDRHAVSEDGIEMTFATNYLGHFLLTKLLLEKMAETAKESGIEGRIVNVSSTVHSWFTGDGIQYLDQITHKKIPYDPTKAYSFSKLANVLHAKALSERIKEMKANITANCVNPGVVRTQLTRDREGLMTDLMFFISSKFIKTIPQAAATACYVAVHPAVTGVSGKYFSDCNELMPSNLASNSEEALRLWNFSDKLIAEKAKIGDKSFV